MAKDDFLIRFALKNLRQTQGRMKELHEIANDGGQGPWYMIGYLQGTVEAALSQLEDFARANPDFTDWGCLEPCNTSQPLK